MNVTVVNAFEKLSNFRDAGGLKASDGRTMRTGVLFRSDELARMTGRDVVRLQEFRIRLICDLRSPEESRRRQSRVWADDGLRVVNIPIHDQAVHDDHRKKLVSFLFGRTGGERYWEFSQHYYRHIAFERTTAIRDVITLLGEDENLPALIHCTAGKDRTGFVVALIQLLAGVPYEVVRDEYLRTNEYLAARRDRFIAVMRGLTLFQVSRERMNLLLMAHAEFLDVVHELIVERHGSVEQYLAECCGIKREALQRLKERLLA